MARKKEPRFDSNFSQNGAVRLRRASRAVMIITPLVSAYSTGVIDALLTHRDNVFRIGTAVVAFLTTQYTLVLFPLITGVIGGITLYTTYKAWEESRREDPLCRGFLRTKDSAPYGDAHFAEPWEYVDAAQIRPADQCKGKIIGQLDQDGKLCVDFNPYEGRMNSHIAAIGRSRAGKTYGLVKSYLLQTLKVKNSVIVADPKGDLFRETSSVFRDNGYYTFKLDLKDLEKSDGWDCMKTLIGPNMITNAQIFARTIVDNIAEREDVHTHGGTSLLTALILRVLQGTDYPLEKKNIRTVHELLQNPGGVEFFDSIMSPDILKPEESACIGFYTNFKTASGNLGGNIIMQLRSGIGLLNNPLLRDILSTDDIDITLAGKEPTVIYLNFPDTNNTFKFLVSVFFSMAFINLVDYADIHTSDGKLPVAVDFLLDEFPALGVIPDWDRKIATVASRRINCIMIIQDIPQLKKTYETSYLTLLNNTGCILTLGINDPEETADYLSKRIGETSIEVVSESQAEMLEHADPYSKRKSKGIGKRMLLSVSEICEIPRDGSLLIFSDHQPVYSTKFPFTLHPYASKLYDTLPADVIDFSNQEERKELRRIEAAYRAQYWETHQKYPDMHYKDISDAIMQDPPLGPGSMMLSILREDLHALRVLICKIRKRFAKASQTDTPELNKEHNATREDEELAEKGAFRKYYEQYVKEKTPAVGIHTYEDISIQFDTETGEIISLDEGEEMTASIKPANTSKNPSPEPVRHNMVNPHENTPAEASCTQLKATPIQTSAGATTQTVSETEQKSKPPEKKAENGNTPNLTKKNQAAQYHRPLPKRTKPDKKQWPDEMQESIFSAGKFTMPAEAGARPAGGKMPPVSQRLEP